MKTFLLPAGIAFAVCGFFVFLSSKLERRERRKMRETIISEMEKIEEMEEEMETYLSVEEIEKEFQN